MKILILVTFFASFIWGYYSQLNHPYTLKTFDALPLEQEHHNSIISPLPISHIYPSYCNPNSSKVCDSYNLSYSDSNKFIGVKAIGGIEYRYQEIYSNTTKAFDGGIILGAKHSFMDLYLDARLFSEFHSQDKVPSYDREFVDKQTEAVNDQASFTSYARYRGNMNFYFGIGTISIARDAIHWGPGIYNNMIFNQNAIPFNHLTYQTQIGPLKVITLYGKLLLENTGPSELNKFDRDLYAHRYELSILKNITLGISEQMILFENNQPFLFVPFVPLFIEKGLVDENSNNGNLSIDVCYRFPNIAKIYSEFFLDDMESPGTLFTKGFIQNKWGLLLGSHFIYDLNNFSNGFIFEYARLEPYAYTHFEPNTAQIANQGYPLGNQLGPNSQVLNFKIYTRYKKFHYFSIKFDITQKGDDYGSHIDDLTPHGHTYENGKTFLKGAEPEYSFEPYFSTQWKYLKLEGSYTFAKYDKLLFRSSIQF
ncbi:MAG: hypothetical protein OCC49_09430 [Fibrobacterales bacterium]